MKKILYILLLTMLIASPLMAQEVLSPTFYISPRTLGMGGAFTAVSNNPDSVFYNPSGYGYADTKDFFLLDTTFRFNFDTLQLIQKVAESGQDFETLLNDQEFVNSIIGSNLGMGFTGPLFLGWVGNNFGIALYDNANVSAEIKKGTLLPKLEADITIEAGTIIGYSFNIGNRLFLGANAKFFKRVWSHYEGGLLEFYNSISGGDISSLDLDYNSGNGISFDFSATYRMGNMNFAFVWKDIYSNVSYYSTKNPEELITAPENITMQNAKIDDSMVFGWSMDLGNVIPALFYDVTLAADIQGVDNWIHERFVEKKKNTLWTKLYMGFSAKSLGILTIRGGLMQGYPTFGLGIDLAILQMNFAYYTVERSSIPGFNPESSILVNFSMIW